MFHGDSHAVSPLWLSSFTYHDVVKVFVCCRPNTSSVFLAYVKDLQLLLNHSSIDGYILNSFDITNNSLNFYKFLGRHIFISVGNISDRFMGAVVRNCQTGFWSGCASQFSPVVCEGFCCSSCTPIPVFVLLNVNILCTISWYKTLHVRADNLWVKAEKLSPVSQATSTLPYLK